MNTCLTPSSFESFSYLERVLQRTLRIRQCQIVKTTSCIVRQIDVQSVFLQTLLCTQQGNVWKTTLHSADCCRFVYFGFKHMYQWNNLTNRHRGERGKPTQSDHRSEENGRTGTSFMTQCKKQTRGGKLRASEEGKNKTSHKPGNLATLKLCRLQDSPVHVVLLSWNVK